jgi:lambda family phage portal protein
MRVNLLDRLIGYLNPAGALRRIGARTMLHRAYEAASPRDPWRPRRAGASAQADHMADATKLRAKARFLVQNVPYISASVDALVDNVIGTGIVPRFTGPYAKKLNEMFGKWIPECDADGRLDLFGLEGTAYRAGEVDGEALVRLRPRRLSDGLTVPLQLQVLEIDWLDSTRNSLLGGSPEVAPGNVVIEGIEYDALGRVAAYWLWDQHPGDVTVLTGTRNFSKRVPASSIIHLFDPKRPGQGRGITRLAPVIALTRDLALYSDAEIARKNLETRLGVVVSGEASDMANPPPEGPPPNAADVRKTGDLGELASGAIIEMPPGAGQVTTIEPKPAGGYVEYFGLKLHIVTAALGVTYEMATGDMSQTNFSSARVRLQDVRRGFERTQWHIVIPRLGRPIADAFVAAAKDAGLIPESAQYGIEFDVPKWDYVNPMQEAQSDALQIATGLTSISAKHRARGDDPQTVFKQIADDFRQLASTEVGKGVSVLDVLFFLQKGTLRVTDQSNATNLAGDPVEDNAK